MQFMTNGCVRIATSDRICALFVKLDCGGQVLRALPVSFNDERVSREK